MTTVIDPLGTPSAIYNKSGTTIQEVTAVGTTGSGATQLEIVSQTSIYLVATDDGETAIKLPASAEIGDFLEIHLAVDGHPSVRLYDTSNSPFLLDFSRCCIRRVKDSGTDGQKWKLVSA